MEIEIMTSRKKKYKIVKVNGTKVAIQDQKGSRKTCLSAAGGHTSIGIRLRSEKLPTGNKKSKRGDLKC